MTKVVIRYNNNLAQTVRRTWAALRKLNAPIFAGSGMVMIQDYGMAFRPSPGELQDFIAQQGISFEIFVKGEWVKVDDAPADICMEMLKSSANMTTSLVQ
jgi:hypothetical protein